jgi:hypothetical protein
LVTQHHIGHVIQEYSVVGFQKAVDQMLSMDLQQFKQSLQKIKPELHWDKEVDEMKKVYAPYLM